MVNVIEKLKNMSKKKLIIISSILVSVLFFIWFIDYSLYKPSPINRFIASNVYKTPANSAFKDDNFYQCVVDYYNMQNKTNMAYTVNLNDSQLKTLTYLTCDNYGKTDNKKIKNTSGLEKMTNLKLLSFTSNLLETINLSKNTNLEEIYLGVNKLEEINVKNNTKLKVLDVGYWTTVKTVKKDNNLSMGHGGGVFGNNIKNLDLSNNLNLTKLYVYENQLTSLDISNNPNLKILNVSNNDLSDLNVSKNPNLTHLDAIGNQLTTLDVSKNTNLTKLDVKYNKLTSLNLNNNKLLSVLDVYDNQITNISFSANSNLTDIDARVNKLTSLDLRNISSLRYLSVSSNQLTNLNITKNSELYYLNVANNNLAILDLTNNTKLDSLIASYNQLVNLNISKNVALKELYAKENQLTSLDLSKNILLEELELGDNQLISLDVSNNLSLIDLDVSENKLTSLDVRKNLLLEYLSVSNNQLTMLDLNKNINLKSLYASDNKFEKNIGRVFINETISLDKTKEKFVKLPSQLKFETVSELSSGIKIENNLIRVTKSGTQSYKNDYGNYSEKYILEVVDVKSNIYIIDKINNYILVGNVTNKEIMNNITVENGTGTIEGDYYVVKNGDDVVKKFKIVKLSSNYYNLKNDYIYIENQTDEQIISNITSNANIAIKNNELIISNGTTVIKKYKLVRVNCNVYDLNKDYIYIGTESNIEMLNNINIVNGTTSVDSTRDKLFFKYGSVVLKEFDIIKFKKTQSFMEYVIGDNYIFVGNDTNEEILSKINLLRNNEDYSKFVSIKDGYLDIVVENDLLEHLKIVGNNFGDYKVIGTSYLYVGTDTYEDMEQSISDGMFYVDKTNGKLVITQNDTEIKKYEIIRLNVLSDKYVVGNDYIFVSDNKNTEVLNNLQLIRSNKDYTDKTTVMINDGYVVLKMGITNTLAKLKIINANFGNYKQYEIDGKKYLYVGTDTYKDIKSKVTFADGEVIVDETNGLLKLKKDDIEINYEIIRLKSLNDKYVLGNNYLYANNDTDNNIKSNIELSIGNNIFNSIKTVEDSYLKIKLNENIELANIKIINIFSNKYNVNNSDYIYVGASSDEEIINNIETDADISIKIKDNILNISYDKFSKKYTLIRVSSDVYNLNTYGIFDLEHDNLLKDIKVINGTLEVQDHFLIVKYKNAIVGNIPIVSIWSDDYKITDEYIFTGFDGREFDTSKVKGSDYVDFKISYYDLLINYHTEKVGEIPIYYFNNVSRDLNVDEKNNIIYLNEEETYQNFMQSISTSSTSITTRIVDKNSSVVEELKSGNRLEVLYNNKVIDSYTFWFNNSSLIYNDESKVERTEVFGIDYLKNLNINNTFINVKDLIQTDGTINIKDKDNNLLEENSKIKTGDKLEVTFLEYNYLIHLSVLGDVVGNGIIDNADVNESYEILRNKKQVDRQYYLASDLTKDGKLKLNDVAKLYQYVRGKVDILD